MTIIVVNFRNLANMGKSKSLDTEDPPGEAGCLRSDYSRTLEDSCRSCSDTDKARDLELNKVRRDGDGETGWE